MNRLFSSNTDFSGVSAQRSDSPWAPMGQRPVSEKPANSTRTEQNHIQEGHMVPGGARHSLLGAARHTCSCRRQGQIWRRAGVSSRTTKAEVGGLHTSALLLSPPLMCAGKQSMHSEVLSWKLIHDVFVMRSGTRRPQLTLSLKNCALRQ